MQLDKEKIIEAMAIADYEISPIFIMNTEVKWHGLNESVKAFQKKRAEVALKTLARFIPSNNELYNHWHDFLRDPDKVAEHCGFSEYQAELLSQIKEFGND